MACIITDTYYLNRHLILVVSILPMILVGDSLVVSSLFVVALIVNGVLENGTRLVIYVLCTL